ncbi:MAG: hypothetical protein IPO93_02845 [Actinobacteria bacterium]|nr:hypothetical protein [Actinomycetota bacterium]
MTEPDRDPVAAPLAVTVVVSRRPAPGREDELTAWGQGISEAATRFPGHLAVQLYPPTAPDREDLVIAFSFATAADLSAWEGSSVRREWLAKAQPLVEGPTRPQSVSGFEGIFAPSVQAMSSPPPRWKTASIIAMALYPASLLINWLVIPQVVAWNIFLRVALSTLLIVPWMTWLGVPYLTKWLRPWLTRTPR